MAEVEFQAPFGPSMVQGAEFWVKKTPRHASVWGALSEQSGVCVRTHSGLSRGERSGTSQ
ncbi:hypothetical protein N7532_009601 [Penicillium argentinense]|uniref:Uncharacterized protein n=1 Tax=Penicillium argentinense TaxID=1131581 RepID=A0A9W9K3M3_9EURO|nr:uncharacterized protein N7532_009601 [Penicillium argentinense]KAJ5090917.1 hypothetical protein N7532_009601 [Penicillium argentinense]